METLNEIKSGVDHPAYYGGKDNPYEAVKVLHAWGLDTDAYLWTAGKYLSQAGKKDGNSLLKDLSKARWYLDYKIQLLTEQQKVAEEVADTLKKMPKEVTDELTKMPSEINSGNFYDERLGGWVNDCVYRPNANNRAPHIAPNIETAVVPSAPADTMSPNNNGDIKIDHSMLNSKVCADEVKF